MNQKHLKNVLLKITFQSQIPLETRYAYIVKVQIVSEEENFEQNLLVKNIYHHYYMKLN